MFVLTPARVSRFVVEADKNTIEDQPLEVSWGENEDADGYEDSVDLFEWFWVVKGARMYPPSPRLFLIALFAKTRAPWDGLRSIPPL
jgi:hypothetical protein